MAHSTSLVAARSLMLRVIAWASSILPRLTRAIACFTLARSEAETGDATAFGAGISGSGAATAGAGAGTAASRPEGRASGSDLAGASAAVLVPPGAGRARGRGTRAFALAVLLAAGFAAALVAVLALALAFAAGLPVVFAGAASTAPALRPRTEASAMATARRRIRNLRGRFITSVIPCPGVRLQGFFTRSSRDALSNPRFSGLCGATETTSARPVAAPGLFLPSIRPDIKGAKAASRPQIEVRS